MKVTFLNTDANLGGAERSLLDLMTSLRDCGVGPLSLIVGGEGPLLDHARAMGVETRVLLLPPAVAGAGDSGTRGPRRMIGVVGRVMAAGLSLRGYTREVRRVLAELAPDVIHSNSIKFHVLSRWIGLERRPVVWHLRDFVGARPLAAYGLRWAARRASKALAISKAVADDLRSAVPGLPVAVVHNAIDTESFAPGPVDSAWLDHVAGLPPRDVIRVGLVATYSHWKGHRVFLEAASLTKRADVRFYVVGGPIYATEGSQVSRSDLRAQAEKLKIEDRVGFIDFQEDVACIYRCLDIAVHASTQPEPFGRTIVEAMASGCACVVSRSGGAAELFEERRTGLGVPPGNAHAMAAAVNCLVEDASLRGALGRAGREEAIARFSRARLGPAVRSIYEAVTGIAPVRQIRDFG